MSSGWYNVRWTLRHPDEFLVVSHSDDLWTMQDVIWMTCDVALCHPDEIAKIWSLSHPDDLPIPSISSGWVPANSLGHPDDILFHLMSSRWLNWGWYLVWMSYGNVIMSSGWDTLPFLSHPNEIANFDFPQHAVALQHIRIELLVNRVRVTFSGLVWDSVDMAEREIVLNFEVNQRKIILADKMGKTFLPCRENKNDVKECPSTVTQRWERWNRAFEFYVKAQGAVSIRKTVLPGMAIPMLKIRRPNGRLIFNMEIAIRI